MVMADNPGPRALAPTTAFRHESVPVADAVVDERRAGVAAEIAEAEPRDGAVPPPRPTRPAPTESLAIRLRQHVEGG